MEISRPDKNYRVWCLWSKLSVWCLWSELSVWCLWSENVIEQQPVPALSTSTSNLSKDAGPRPKSPAGVTVMEGAIAGVTIMEGAIAGATIMEGAIAWLAEH
jgi:hypothetical protein